MLHEQYQKSTQSRGRPNYILFDDIRECLDGFARIVAFRNTNPGSLNKNNMAIEMVIEGQFKDGLKHGYCRLISCVDGSCALGHHYKGEQYGKWCYYKPDGDFMMPEGIYKGQECT